MRRVILLLNMLEIVLILKKELSGKINKMIEKPQQTFYSLLGNIGEYFYYFYSHEDIFQRGQQDYVFNLLNAGVIPEWCESVAIQSFLEQPPSIVIQQPSKVLLNIHRMDRYVTQNTLCTVFLGGSRIQWQASIGDKKNVNQF